MNSPKNVLSHGTLLGAIEASQKVISQKIEEANQERATRDHLIQIALESKTPYRTLMRLTGLSRTSLVKIQERPHSNNPKFEGFTFE